MRGDGATGAPWPREPSPHLRSPAPTAGRGRLFEQEMLPEREWGLPAMPEPPSRPSTPASPPSRQLAGTCQEPPPRPFPQPWLVTGLREGSH